MSNIAQHKEFTTLYLKSKDRLKITADMYRAKPLKTLFYYAPDLIAIVPNTEKPHLNLLRWNIPS